MRKGVNALEIVFGMFLLIIVVFVVIRLITNFVRTDKIEAQFKDFEQSSQYNKESEQCKTLCENYNANNCNRRDAVNYCLQKVKLDIDGNSIPGEKGHGNFVRNLPYCEDGLYCFHIYDCYCSNYKLDASSCLQLLCDYYVYDEKISDRDAIKLIASKTGIHWGTCNVDTSKWKLGYEPPTTMRADWWFRDAGYYSLRCENLQPGLAGIDFESCEYDKNSGNVKCETNCITPYGSGPDFKESALIIHHKKGDFVEINSVSINEGSGSNKVTISSDLKSACSLGSEFTILFFCLDPQGYGTVELSC